MDKGIETDGSNLSGVSAKCAWDDLSRPPEDEDDSRSICIGSQPRRLSDKGEECKGQCRVTNLKTRCMLQRCCIASSYYIVVSSKCVLFIQTLNKLEKP